MSFFQTITGMLLLGSLFISTPEAFAWRDSPEVSRHAGWSGQVVILWTRTTPIPTDPIVMSLERALQQRLEDIVASVAPEAPQNVRPDPERVCRKKGCRTISIAATLLHQDDGCAAVAVITGAGPSQSAVVPWGGVMELSDEMLPFRDPPEELVTVNDFVPCTRFLEHLNDIAVTETLRAMIGLESMD